MNNQISQNENKIMRILRSPALLQAGPFLFFTALFLLFFSPIIFTGHLLAPHDGLRFSIPNFYSERTLWTNLLFSGYPAAADPQAQTWYPLAFVFSLFPNSWNAYIISAYVLSACFMFGYVWTVTQSRMAALVAGIGYSMSGFMIGRLGQPPLIHAAIWLPLIFWVIEKNRHKPSPGWTAVGSLAIACSFLAGHTQIIFYGLIVAGAYVVYMGRIPVLQRWSYFRNFVWMVLMGIGLVGIQLLPTMELVEWSARSELSFSDFVEFSFSSKEALMLFFPYLFGGGIHLYDIPYFGPNSGMEIPGYLGLSIMLLAVLAIAGSHKSRLVRFWLATLLVGFLLALGEHTPLSQVLYYLPGFNKFRGPLRHFLEISLAVSVLAGLGADCIQRKKIRANQIKGVILGAVGIFGLSLAAVWIFPDKLEQAAFQINVESLPVVSWRNAALWVPVCVMTLAVGALIFWWKRPVGRISRFLLLTLLVIDLGSFGWFHHWREFAPSLHWFQPPEATDRYQKLLNESHQRLVSVKGLYSERNQFPVNISRLWGLPSAAGYNPLMLSRVQEILSIYNSGAIVSTWSSVKHRALDILGVRYLFLPVAFAETFETQKNQQWTRENLGIRLGSGCNQSYPSSIEFSFPQGFSASRIGVVSKAFCAGNIPDGEAVLRFHLSGDQDQKRRTTDFVMGRDTAEWGYDCKEVKDPIRHRQASVFRNFPISNQSGTPCHGSQYVAEMPISPARSWKQIQVEWLGKPGVVQLDKITLVDEKSGRVLPLRELTASDHWRFKERIEDTAVYENLDAMPRAWLVPEAVPARPQDILHAIYYSTLPDGRPFDPAKTALIEESHAFQATSFDPSGKVDVIQLEDTEIVLQTQSASDSFLVTSDIYYPGWEATIDGQPAPLYRTDFVLRGISLPAGSHEVRFKYHPKSLYAGITVTILSIVILILYAIRPFPQK